MVEAKTEVVSPLTQHHVALGTWCADFISIQQNIILVLDLWVECQECANWFVQGLRSLQQRIALLRSSIKIWQLAQRRWMDLAFSIGSGNCESLYTRNR